MPYSAESVRPFRNSGIAQIPTGIGGVIATNNPKNIIPLLSAFPPMSYFRKFNGAPRPRRNQLQCHLNAMYCIASSAGGGDPRFPRMLWRAYSSWAMCVHDGSAPRGPCASAAMSYAADLEHCPISRTDLLRRRCIHWVADMVWKRTRRGPIVSSTSAPPRIMRLRVVGPQCPILGLAYPPVRYRARVPPGPWRVGLSQQTS